MRVAVTQFATSSNVQKNLTTCIRIINEAAECKPSLIILPELCNTLFSSIEACYVDHNQAWSSALSIEGSFLQAIANQAVKHNCYIVINVSVRRDDFRDHQNSSVKSNISITSCLFSPLGELIHQIDKQTLIGHENTFFTCANHLPETIVTSKGSLALLISNDDVTFNKARSLSLQGVQLLCQSVSTFSLDQSQMYSPARASENKVFLASANKIGPLVESENILTELNATAQRNLIGAGQSQIVSPDGEILAKLNHNEEGFIFAEIDLSKTNNKVRPDATDLFAQLRPELYKTLTAEVNKTSRMIDDETPLTVNVAIFATYKTNEQAIEDVCHYIDNNLSDIIQLPELFFIADKTLLNNTEHRAEVECLSQQLINQVSAKLRPFQYVCTSVVINGVHQAVIISEKGIFAAQQQLHFCQRYNWTELGDNLNITDLPLEQGNIKVAILTADDANIPEIVKVASLNHIHALLVPFDIQEPCEVEHGLISRAAEHRICIVAASREKNFTNVNSTNLIGGNNNNIFGKNKVKSRKSTGFIATLAANSALFPQTKTSTFNGVINQPIVKHQHGKITKALIHPAATCSKCT